jgi:hypothetical protein
MPVLLDDNPIARRCNLEHMAHVSEWPRRGRRRHAPPYPAFLRRERRRTDELDTVIWQQSVAAQRKHRAAERHTLLASEFDLLVKQWRRDTEISSSPTVKTSHPAYLRIIAFGRVALPFIYKELLASRGHWFAALSAITNADPIPPKHRGNMSLMIQDWIEYLRQHENLEETPS